MEPDETASLLDHANGATSAEFKSQQAARQFMSM